MVWGKNGTPNTLTIGGDILEITDLTGKKFNQIMYYAIATGGTIAGNFVCNDDTTNSHSIRYNTNGASESTDINRSDMGLFAAGTATFPTFTICYVIGISTEEKLSIQFTTDQNTAGAGTAPTRRKIVGKWADTANTIDEFNVDNSGTGNYATDTNLSAIGTD